MDQPVSSVVRRWRFAHRLSLGDVARAAGWDFSYLWRYEEGRRERPSLRKLSSLADATAALWPSDPLTIDQIVGRAPWAPSEPEAAPDAL